MRVAALGAECQSKGQPQLAHNATKLHHRICESSRPRPVANSGNSPPSDTRHGNGKNIRQRFGNFADEDGRLGLRSATRCAQSAFWASWADALPMIRERTPQVAEMVEQAMVGGQPQGCLGEQEASTRLDREGFWWRPAWPELLHGKRPPPELESQASGNTAGSTGLLPFPTRSSGRPRYCQSVRPLVARTSVPTPDTMLEQRLPTHPQHQST